MSISPRMVLPVLVAAGLMALAPPATAQDQAKTLKGAAADIKAAGNADIIDPKSIDAIKAMGAYLAGLKTIDLSTRFEADLELDNDQNIEIGGTTHYLAERPNKLKAEVKTDLGERSFLFDGKSLYVVAPQKAVYGQLDDVGPTIKDMLDQVQTYSKIDLPISDLFAWGTSDDPAALIAEGFLVGPATVDGKAATHWAYRSEDKDFELWIADGDKPLPLKMSIVDATDEHRPRTEVTLSWNETPQIADTDFVFSPPSGAKEIPILIQDPDEEVTK